MGRWFENVGTHSAGGLRTITPAEVARHNRVDDCWVIFKGAVYDLTEFILDHPGGEDLILQYAGHDVGHVMDDPVQHSHSNSAYLLLEEFQIGRVPDGYVAKPQAPAPPPAAPIAGRAAGAIYAEGNPAGPTPSQASQAFEPKLPPPTKPPPPPVPRAEDLLAPTPLAAPASASIAASVPSRNPLTPPPQLQPPLTPPQPPQATQPTPRIHRMASTSFSFGSNHKDKGDKLHSKESSSSLNFLGYRFHRRR